MMRKPIFAGSFYPANKTDLINQINSFLEKTQKIKEEKPLRILIVPHAGYNYSGQIAAWGFKQLENANYSRVIILGVSHRAYFSKAAIYNQEFWQTPLGKIEIDEKFSDSLINQSSFIESNKTPHEQEHSLEVELPFLEQVLSNFKIVPILLGHSGNEVLESLALAIVNNFDSKTLLVISSDLSHYPPYEIASKVDQETIDSILTADINKFAQKVEENLGEVGVETCACGADAIKVAIIVAKKLGFSEIKLIKYANSGEVVNDKSRVVGYASIGFYDKNLELTCPQSQSDSFCRRGTVNSKLDASQQKRLLEIARQTLESYFKHKKIPEFNIKDELLNQKLGVFVTLRNKGQLRGCIGEFEPNKPLYQVIQEKTINAAFGDPRFYPVEEKELNEIKIEISIMSPKVKIDDWQKIQLGKHGVVVRQGAKGGAFLPQVAKETGWDLKTFLSNLCFKKAGLSADCYLSPETEIFIFTAQVFSEK